MHQQPPLTPAPIRAALAVPFCGTGAGRRLLVTRRLPNKRFAGLWEWPGGSVEASESPAQAAIRELLEETGVSAEPNRATLLCTHSDPGPPAIDFWVYLIELADPTPPRLLQCSDARWVTPEEAFDREFPPTNRAINARIRRWLSE